MVYLWLTMSRSGTVAGSQKHQANLQWERRLIPTGLTACPRALWRPTKKDRKIAKSTQQSALIY